jgi:hypothetical protein
MSTRTFIYALWCLGVAGLFAMGAIYAWSPFAEGSRARTHAGFYGPTHK